ncbi:cryptochrome/photolyase family protein [Patiriisocius marinus]|uniref:Deoxyribodipyrimidine photo-lyase n=1 Tax=Patiriisocius marinus TaxID=1397112 RepID=A0A5J4IWJ2_9FLAO|nr:deoxyribodipyrimidine photo-lyase [Patiriisocius marinus]GER59354.1 deoxyribodipyrimidine photo-lyase [Patiriisocius marinus]
MAEKLNIFWFRRDLRLEDNVGFHKALNGKYPVMPIFIFDSEILNELPKDDARVTFIHETLQEMRNKLQERGSSLAIYHGKPIDVYKNIVTDYNIQNVITNRDYEVYAQERDKEIKKFLSTQKQDSDSNDSSEIGFYDYKDQVIFEKDDVVKADGDPYVVYTPFKNKWKDTFEPKTDLKNYPCEKHFDNLYAHSRLPNMSLSDIGFEKSKIDVPSYKVTPSLINNYEDTRNFPAIDGTSHLGPHLRFGTVSVRKMMEKAIAEKNEVFWSELIWREFFTQIIWHFPKTQHDAFRSKYDRIKWRNNEDEFEKWKTGTTGYALVDAGMRQLNKTGYMHNRVRMLVASFLCKHLLIDWRWGEAYFAEKLLDYEQASNVGNWQWAAGSGVDAAPYFRIFNPITQVDKFDKDKKYIKNWIPEFGTDTYPEMMVDHKEARERCLKVYKEAVS